MTSPEFRCLICDNVLAEGTDAALPRETCTQCGKAILKVQPPAPAAGELPMAEVVPLAKVVEPPTVLPHKPPPIPEVFPKAKVVAPTVPTVQPKQERAFRPVEVPDAALPKPKLAFALFVTFMTFLAIIASLTVLLFTIVYGLKKAAKRVDAVPTVRVTTAPTPGK